MAKDELISTHFGLEEVSMEEKFKMEFKFDHVHIKCHDVNVVKRFYEKMFSGRVVSEGMVRNASMVVIELGGTHIILTEPGDGEKLEPLKSPREDVWIRYGIGHFGLCVKDLDEAARELRAKGAEFIWEPREVRGGVRVAFIRAPEDDVIEIVQRSK